MDRYKIGEVITFKVNKGVIVYEYIGRGLNGLLKLKEGDKYVDIAEDGGVFPWHNDPDSLNDFRTMYGKFIHAYDIDPNDYKFAVKEYTPINVGAEIHDWIKFSGMSQEDVIKLFNPDVNQISELMDRCLSNDDNYESYEDDDDNLIDAFMDEEDEDSVE
jgi:hypothetical protein